MSPASGKTRVYGTKQPDTAGGALDAEQPQPLSHPPPGVPAWSLAPTDSAGFHLLILRLVNKFLFCLSGGPFLTHRLLFLMPVPRSHLAL